MISVQSINSKRQSALELGIKDQERYIDMQKMPRIPLYFATHRDKYYIVREELSISPYIWIGQPRSARGSGIGYGRIFVYTNSYKIDLSLNNFNDGTYYFLVGGIYPKKQRDTIYVIKNALQAKHNFTLFLKGESSYAQHLSAKNFFDLVEIKYQQLGIKREIIEEEEIDEQDNEVLDFCNTHIELINFEEEYDKNKGYDFKYNKIKTSEKSDNVKGVTYAFYLDKANDNLDKESLQGAEIIVKEEEDEEGVKGYIADVDTEYNILHIKFPKSVNYYELPEVGLIKKSDKNVSFPIQRSAFQSLLEGKAANENILNILISNEYKPIDEIEHIRSDRLTKSQQKAINKALSVDDFLLVQGPPGTGKTEIIVEMIQEFSEQGKKVLISSKNNLAVDNVLEKCIDRNIKCIRLGRPESVKIEKVKSVLVDVFSLNIQKEIDQATRSYQNTVKEEREINKEKLNHAYKLKDAVFDHVKVSKKLIKSKLILFLFKILVFLRIIRKDSGKYLRRMSDVSEYTRQKEALKNLIDNEVNYLELDSKMVWKRSERQNYIENKIQFLLNRIGDVPKKIEITDKWLEDLSLRHDVLTEVTAEDIKVIGATCIGVNTNRIFNSIEYDVAIIDEAGQITLHDVIVPISKAKKVIVIGDHMQLPPVTDDDFINKTREKYKDMEVDFYETYKQSLFEKLFYEADESHKIMLDTQFRMHEDIAEPISQLFYGGNYKTGCKTEHRLIDIAGFKDPMVFLDTIELPDKYETVTVIDQETKQVAYTNPTEARIIASVLERMIIPLQDGLTVLDYKGEKEIDLGD
ncbi:MAG: AAA family ATPase, partial [Clostridiaceae bacterium]|nr:AAA family ATPase [Clostridiaceae bacterium]